LGNSLDHLGDAETANEYRGRELGVLLDLDGTIVDSMVPLKEAFISISSMIGIRIDEEQQRGIGKDLRFVMEGRSTRFSELKLIWRIGRILKLPWWKRVLLPLIAYHGLKQTARRAPPVKGVTEAIAYLKKAPKVKLGLVTSRSRKDAVRKLRSLGLLDYFDAIVTRDDVRSLKPSPEQVRLASKMLRLPVKACALVGDMPTDVHAAKEAGALAVAVGTGIFHEDVRSSRPDLIIASVADLPKSLGEISARLKR